MTQAPDWGGILRRVRRDNRLSQRALAERAGVSKTAIARLETGSGSRVDSRQLAAVLACVGCRIVVLTEDDDEVLPFDTDEPGRDIVGKRFPAHVRVYRWVGPPGRKTTVHFQFGRRELDILPIGDVDDRVMPLPDGPIRRVYRDNRYGPGGWVTRGR